MHLSMWNPSGRPRGFWQNFFWLSETPLGSQCPCQKPLCFPGVSSLGIMIIHHNPQGVPKISCQNSQVDQGHPSLGFTLQWQIQGDGGGAPLLTKVLSRIGKIHAFLSWIRAAIPLLENFWIRPCIDRCIRPLHLIHFQVLQLWTYRNLQRIWGKGQEV